MGREISRLDFSAETRREMLSRLVSSRLFLVSIFLESLELGILKYQKSRICLDLSQEFLVSSRLAKKLSRPIGQKYKIRNIKF